MSYDQAGAVIYAKNAEQLAVFYAQVMGLTIQETSEDFLVLEGRSFQLVIVQAPESIAASIQITTPPLRREQTPIKLAFLVKSLEDCRQIALTWGGEVDSPNQEWQFGGHKVCDGYDCEGNVFQLREHPS